MKLFVIIAYSDPIIFDKIKAILPIIIWPILLLFAFITFKKIFSYFFFSLREFNFFGNKGELKSPINLINEKAEEKLKEETKKEKLINSSKNSSKNFEMLLKWYNEQNKLIKDLKEENEYSKIKIQSISAIYQSQINALLQQIASLQTDSKKH